jgi:hypothetical protein
MYDVVLKTHLHTNKKRGKTGAKKRQKVKKQQKKNTKTRSPTGTQTPEASWGW